MVSETLNFSAIVFIGPTASGKTSLSHFVADELLKRNIICELVNLDAFQIYHQLNIGTAKPSEDEIKKYHYHNLNLLSIQENIDANLFASMAQKACAEIKARGHIPLCLGGSGLYLRAFLHGLDELPSHDPKIRADIRKQAAEKGWPWCHQWLSTVDPVRAAELHPNDKVRIERALEIFLISGKPISTLRSKTKNLNTQNTLFSCYLVHLEPDEIVLRNNIAERTQQLFHKGWLEEVENLYSSYGAALTHFHAIQAIGYREILSFVLSPDGKPMNKDQLICNIATQTRQYAKRQRTWNAKEKKDFAVTNFSLEEKSVLIDKLVNFITSPI